jgi:glutamate-5-semialdehyde dehydrogenase
LLLVKKISPLEISVGMEEQPGLLKNKMDLQEEINLIGTKAKQASAVLNTASSSQKNSFFDLAIKNIKSDKELILMANHQDISQARDNGKDNAFLDRLELNHERIEEICKH